jgi:hypothetical protein
VPKFELYKHNDELFNIYYRIFYELWTFAYFDRLCKLEKKLCPAFQNTDQGGRHSRTLFNIGPYGKFP